MTEQEIISHIIYRYQTSNDEGLVISEMTPVLKMYRNPIKFLLTAKKTRSNNAKVELLGKLVKIICKRYEIESSELLSKKRGPYTISDARHAYCIAAFSLLTLNKSQIATSLSRNHATVINSLKQVRTLMLDDDWKAKFELVEKDIKKLQSKEDNDN